MVLKHNSSTASPSLLITLIFLVSLTFYSGIVSAAQEQDSIQVKNLLLLDTLTLQISGPSSDVSFYMNGMVFLSNTKYHQKMIPDHISFGVVKTYFVPLDYLSLESSRPLFPNDDFPYDPAGMSFSRDYKTVYFTKPVELAGRRTVEKIFEMSINEGKATAHLQLPFTTEPSRYLHPAISQNDSILVFSSDRTPNSGGLDLFVSRKTSSGWSAPVNLGRGINTSGHEWFPFLDHANNLYFSSSGHMGFGGYDIYVCRWDGSGWGSPQNLTSFMNTPGDELAFSIHPNNKISVFNRIMGTDNKGIVLLVSLNSKAFPAADAVDPRSRDICLLIQDMTGSGYTSGQFLASGNESGSQAFNLEAMPLLTLQEAEAEKKLDQMKLTSESGSADAPARPRLDLPDNSSNTQASAQLPELSPEGEKPAAAEPEVVSPPDPDRLNFRVQILSSTKPNSRPEVTVDGKKYATFEYYHKGAYRITVGDFPTVKEANAFRAKCKSSGFNQSFVAAFRGEVRETDPSVFRQQ
jgi:hypothetical protein